jgi:hypothetical protein
VTNQVPAGAKVQFYDLNGNSDGPVATAIADPVTGNYTQTLPDSSYGVITQNSDGLINKIWNNVPCSAVCNVNSITGVTVAGNAVTNINFILDPGGRIAGTVTDAATGLPIAGATVLFLDPGPNVPFSSAVTDASGHYISDGGSATGTVYVGAIAIGYQAEMYDNIKCPALNCDPPVPANVAVTLGATTNNIDFALDPGGRISGTVTNANGTPLANVEVRTFDSTGDNVDETFTDASGNWTSTGLPSGTYYVGTRRSGYAERSGPTSFARGTSAVLSTARRSR